METVIPKTKCPTCGYKMDRSTLAYETIDKAPPREGDVSICLGCGTVLVFNADLTMRLPSKDEAALFATDPRITGAQITRSYIVGDKIKDRL